MVCQVDRVPQQFGSAAKIGCSLRLDRLRTQPPHLPHDSTQRIGYVVGVHQATTRLKDGQRIRVDGTAGKIIVLE